jgi:hypothetical protein
MKNIIQHVPKTGYAIIIIIIIIICNVLPNVCVLARKELVLVNSLTSACI